MGSPHIYTTYIEQSSRRLKRAKGRFSSKFWSCPPDCLSGGCEFESRPPRFWKPSCLRRLFLCNLQVFAQKQALQTARDNMRTHPAIGIQFRWWGQHVERLIGRLIKVSHPGILFYSALTEQLPAERIEIDQSMLVLRRPDFSNVFGRADASTTPPDYFFRGVVSPGRDWLHSYPLKNQDLSTKFTVDHDYYCGFHRQDLVF